MPAGLEKYEISPPTFTWVEYGASNNFVIYWGGKYIGGGTKGPTSFTGSDGTFNRGTFKVTSTSPVPPYQSDFYAVSKDYPSGAGPNTVIYGADYNAVQVKTAGILGTGSYYSGPTNGYGYGQTVQSTTVSPTQVIAADEWTKLTQDINKAFVHQLGSTSSYITAMYAAAVAGSSITYDQLSVADALANGLVANRLSAASNQITLTTGVISQYVDLVWGGSGSTDAGGGNFGGTSPSTVDSVVDITFASSTELHYFFNQRGSFILAGLRDTGATGLTAQEQAWYDLAGSAGGTVDYAARDACVTAGNNVYTNLATFTSSTSPYTGATWTIDVKINNNVMSIRNTLVDNHVPTGSGADYIRANLVGYQMAKSLITGTSTGAFNGPSPTIAQTNTFA